MSNISHLSWEIRVPLESGGKQKDHVLLTRDTAETSVLNARNIVFQSIVDQFGDDLTDKTHVGIHHAVYNPQVFLMPEVSEVQPSEKIEIVNIAPEEIAYKGLRLVTNNKLSKSDRDKTKPPEVRLAVSSIQSEYSDLTQAIKNQTFVTNGHTDIFGLGDDENMKKLQNDSHERLRTATELAAARRIVRYSVVPKNRLPEGLKDLGINHWREAIDSRHDTRITKPLMDIPLKRLSGPYIESGQAEKNARLTLWTPISRRIIRVDQALHPEFPIIYKSVATKKRDAELDFYDGFNTDMPKADVAKILNGIYDPTSSIRKVR